MAVPLVGSANSAAGCNLTSPSAASFVRVSQIAPVTVYPTPMVAHFADIDDSTG